MTLKFTNAEHTAASFNGESFGLAAPSDWNSIGNGPTREAVKAWLAKGNQPEPYEASAIKWIPQSVTMRQARLALFQVGLLQLVDPVINRMPSPQKEAARIEWEYSQEVHRNKPFVILLATALNLTETQLDNLFVLADSIP